MSAMILALVAYYVLAALVLATWSRSLWAGLAWGPLVVLGVILLVLRPLWVQEGAA